MVRKAVLIIGAGPTGLVLALWLTKLGVNVRIIDKALEPGTTSRALAVQARTLELYRQLDLAAQIVQRGHKVPAVNLWVRGKPKARIAFEAVGADLTLFSFLQIFPQDEHERLLIERLSSLGVEVERGMEFLGFNNAGDRIVARLRHASGAEESCEASFIAGCDGARSRVRETMGSRFPGGTYRQVFYVADVEAAGRALDGGLHVDLDDADFLAVFPLARTGHARLIGTVRDERAARAESLQFSDVQDQAIEHLRIDIRAVNWFSTYRVHHRVTNHFRNGRALLLGDAAHIHSPVGGQGMNTGIGDAVNLAWKLHAVLAGRAPDSLLDSYQVERMKFARRLVATTDRIFTLVSAQGLFADLVRTRVAPTVIRTVMSFAYVRELLFRTVSQIELNYRGGPLSEGAAGRVHGGDRLPWIRSQSADNHEPLNSIQWQVHVYGAPRPELEAWCQTRRLPLHRFDWSAQHQQAGLLQNASYLIRPDTYVGLADASATPETIERYFAARGMRTQGLVL